MKILNKLKILQASLLIIIAVFTFLPSISHAQNALGVPCDPNEPDTWDTSTGCLDTNTPVFGANNTTNNTNSANTNNGVAGASSSCASNINNIGDLICKLGSILKSIIPLLVALGVVYFVWGVVQFVIGDGEEAKKKGRDRIIYGLIGLVVIAGLWGLVNIVINTFGIGGQTVDLTNVTSVVSQNNSSGLCDQLANNPNLQQLINYITCIISSSVIPLIFALSVAMFVWGVVQYVINSSEEAKKEKGRQFMIWGIIALVVMVSVWGLVSIVAKTFNINVTTQVAPPKLQSPSNP